MSVEALEPAVDAPVEASPPPVGFVVAASAILAACGGGGGAAPASGGGGGVVVVPPPVVVAPTGMQASRMLAQAAMGSTTADIQRVQSVGYDAWITEQFNTPREIAHWDWLVAQGFNAATNINSENGFNQTMWRQLITGQDQLRQRVGMALLDILVVAIAGINLNWRAFAMAAYVDILWDGAFGNFRTLLDRISTNAAMSSFLTFLGNRRSNGTSVPDENYARELMQLFTIGLQELNLDGSLRMSGGQPIETYSPADVTGLARVFTGFNLDSNDSTTPDRYRRPLINTAATHESGTKVFLGTTIPANTDGPASLQIALNTIFAHPNVGPFIGKQLIQRLVTSNPSPAYVGRVAAAFNNNGAGVRGDMQAVIRAILMDTEARSDAVATGASVGKLREPIMRLTGWARAFGVTSPSNAWGFGDTSSTANRLGQSPGRAPSVFNFFRPGYSPPGSALSTAGLVGPEFQITNEPSVVAYINYMQSLIVSGAGDADPNYTALQNIATDSAALVAEVNLLVAAGQVSPATIATIRTAVDSIASTTPAGILNRIYTAILLVMASPEYITLK